MEIRVRDLPTDRSFTAPHSFLFRAMRRFAADLARAEDDARGEWRALRGEGEVPEHYLTTPEVERLSLAVQVFAAMTIEAAISCHAVIRFGGDAHDEHFRWEPPHKRLQKVLRGVGITVADNSEVLTVVSRVARVRNSIVHPHSQEVLDPVDSGQRRPERQFPRMDGAAARQAIADVERYFELVIGLDPSLRGMLHPW